MMMQLTKASFDPPNNDSKAFFTGFAIGTCTVLCLSTLRRNPKKSDIALITATLLKSFEIKRGSSRTEFFVRAGIFAGIIKCSNSLIDEIKGDDLSPIYFDLIGITMLRCLLLFKKAAENVER